MIELKVNSRKVKERFMVKDLVQEVLNHLLSQKPPREGGYPLTVARISGNGKV